MTGRAAEIADEVLALLASGRDGYFGEAVTKLEHALQCAWHASQASTDDELVIAALLHDAGHLLDTPETIRDPRVGVVNHDATGASWLLERGFSGRVVRLVGGHVDAKRYLTASHGDYLDKLSLASRETLILQGGPMSAEEASAFTSLAEYRDLLRLRTWDEMAKDPAWRGPGLEAYREPIIRHLCQPGRLRD